MSTFRRRVIHSSFLERVSAPFPRRAHFEARPTERAMGNALSGSERWPVRHERAEQFAAMAEGETMTVGAGCYWGTEKWYAKHFGEDWKRYPAVQRMQNPTEAMLEGKQQAENYIQRQKEYKPIYHTPLQKKQFLKRSTLPF